MRFSATLGLLRATTFISGASGVVVAPAATPWTFPAAFTNGSMLVSLLQTTASPSYTTNYSQAAFENTGTTYYVATTGNDTTGDGSSGLPWRTIQKAVDTVASGSKISVGAGRFPNIAVTGKNLSIYGVAGSTFVGDLLAESDITWGAPASGRQTVTLASGAVSGFVDLTKTRRADRQGVAIPQVSQTAATAVGITTLQAKTTTAIELDLYGTPIGTADPQAAVFRSTPSQVGASDGRNLSGKADTELLMWKATSARPLTLASAAQVFAKNITFAGGSSGLQVIAGTRLVMDNCRVLGSDTQLVDQDGTMIAYRTVFRGCAAAGSDLIDYGSNGTTSVANFGVEIECLLDQCGGTGADNCSTQHSGTTLRVNSTYLDASRTVNDGSLSLIGIFGCTLGAAPDSGRYSLCIDGAEGHYAGIHLIATGATDIRIANSLSTNFGRGYFYDNSYAGHTLIGTITDRTGSKPTGDATFIRFDPSVMSTLFQTTDMSTPVTAAGQPVMRINSTLSQNDYVTVTAGTLTYQLDGALPCLVTGTANALALTAFFNDALMEENSNFIIGLKSTDTLGYAIKWGSGGNNVLGNYTATTTSPTGTSTLSPGRNGGAPTYNVDGSSTALTTGNALRAAAFNGAPHVMTMRHINMQWHGYYRTAYLMNFFDGTIYGIEISRAVDAATTRAHEQAMAAKSGATVP